MQAVADPARRHLHNAVREGTTYRAMGDKDDGSRRQGRPTLGNERFLSVWIEHGGGFIKDN
jgi:hypothetical protein